LSTAQSLKQKLDLGLANPRPDGCPNVKSQSNFCCFWPNILTVTPLAQAVICHVTVMHVLWLNGVAYQKTV